MNTKDFPSQITQVVNGDATASLAARRYWSDFSLTLGILVAVPIDQGIAALVKRLGNETVIDYCWISWDSLLQDWEQERSYYLGYPTLA